MSTSTPTCPICHQPLTQDVTGTASCSGCTASFRLLPILSTATLSLPDVADPQATVDAGATMTFTPATPNEPRDDRAPAGYVIERELGRGGMGVVYLARQTRLNRPCALKMILAGGHAGDAERERFETEAQAIARLQHDNIVRVYEIGEHDGRPFMALEFCEGGSLDRKLRDQQPTAREAAALVRTLAIGMQAAHDAHVIHRDLKPANVLLAGDGTPKVTDFGLAKKLDEVGQTHTGSIMGTPSYMPPEQASGKKDLGPAVDVYALGAILYECLTGRPPFKAATPMETIFQVLENEPVAVRQLNPSIPLDLETIAHKCLQKEAGKRYPSAKDLANDLGRFLNGEAIRARPVGTIERAAKWVRRNPIVSALTTTVFLVLTAGIVVSWLYANEAARQAKEAGEKTKEANANAKRADAKTREAEDRTREANDNAKRADAKTREAEENAKRANEEADRALREEARAQDRLRRMEWSNYAGKLLLAQAAFTENNVLDAVRHLEECQWDLRGWEHAHLRWRFDGSKQTLKGHTDSVWSVCFSPDSKRLLTGSEDSTVKLWDAETGQEVLSLKGHTDSVYSVAFSPDGKRILTGSGDKTAKVWDAETGQELLSLKGHTDEVTSVCFSPDGKRILTGSDDETAKVWDAEKGQELLSLKGHNTFQVTSVAFNPDGTRILTGSLDNTAKIWDAEKGNEILTLKGHTAGVTSVCFSPDGKRILTGSRDKTAKVWDAETGLEVLSLKVHTGYVFRVTFSPDGQRILTGSSDTAHVWDAENGTELLSLKGHTSYVTSVAFSPDGKRILTGSMDNTAKVWDAETGQEVLSLKGHTGYVTSVAFSPDGNRILTGSLDKTAKIWDAENGTELLSLKGHTREVTSVAFSPDGKRILTGSGVVAIPGEAKLWDAETGQAVLSLKGHTSGVTSVAFSPDGKRILTGSWDSTAKVWDAEKGQAVLSLKGHTSGVRSVCFSLDGKRILTGSGVVAIPGEAIPGEAKVWDAETGQEVFSLKGHTNIVTSVCFSPDGERILTGSWDKTAKVWDAQKGQEVLSLKGHTSVVTSVAFSPDGKRILTGSYDRTAKVWDAEKGQELLSLKGHNEWVTNVCFSPDGKRILTGSYDGTAKVWDAEKGTEVLILRGHSEEVTSVRFSPDGAKAFAWDVAGKVLAWSIVDGKPIPADNPPPKPAPGSATSPDGRLSAKPEGNTITLIDLLKPPPAGDAWPLPDLAERKQYHTEQADAAEKAGQWFAVAFHLGRLLLDDPDNVELKKRREEALKKHAVP